MISNHARHTVVVPIVGNDISEEAYAKASAFLRQPDSRLVLLHVRQPDDIAAGARREPATNVETRWHRLACTVPNDRTFIDAVVGDPTTAIDAEAERFHSDAIVF
jgi:hypothetical protein